MDPSKSVVIVMHFGHGNSYFNVICIGYFLFSSLMGITVRCQDRIVSYERNKALDGTTAKASVLFLTDVTMSESVD